MLLEWAVKLIDFPVGPGGRAEIQRPAFDAYNDHYHRRPPPRPDRRFRLDAGQEAEFEGQRMDDEQILLAVPPAVPAPPDRNTTYKKCRQLFRLRAGRSGDARHANAVG